MCDVYVLKWFQKTRLFNSLLWSFQSFQCILLPCKVSYGWTFNYYRYDMLLASSTCIEAATTFACVADWLKQQWRLQRSKHQELVPYIFSLRNTSPSTPSVANYVVRQTFKTRPKSQLDLIETDFVPPPGPVILSADQAQRVRQIIIAWLVSLFCFAFISSVQNGMKWPCQGMAAI